MSDIYKLQRPIVGNQYLLYNKDRSILSSFEPSKDIVELMGDNYKLYVKADIDKKGMLMINDVVQQQDW